jgi:glycerol-3-phosphate dehydrogenase subunit B
LPDLLGGGYCGAVNRSPDVVVIGGGMAGVAAALASVSRGASVTLVRRAPGATALTVGGWAGPMSEPLAAAFDAAGHAWLPAAQSGLPSPDGSWRLYQRAAAAQALQLSTPTMVCSIMGLAGFHAVSLSRLWMDLAGVELVPAQIALDATPAAGWSPVSLAGSLERAPGEFASRLQSQVRATGCRSVIVPAVLGLQSADTVRKAIQETAGVAVHEALGSAPSIPGWRLQLALDRMLAHAGVALVKGDVTQRSGSNRVGSIQVQTANGEIDLQAGSFVLATGKFIGGGISANGRLREVALGCPLWIEHAGEIFEHGDPLALTNNDRREEQPLLAAGVTVNAEGRAIDRAGAIVYDNVWAAGTVCRGGEAPTYGLGQAAAEGWAAGERAAA